MVRKGIAASRGRAAAKALFVKEAPKAEENGQRVVGEEEELLKVDDAIIYIAKDMERSEQKYQLAEEQMKLDIIRMQKTMLTDSLFYGNICKLVKKGYNAQAAVHRCVEEQCNALISLGDAYLAERSEDFRDIGNRLVCQIMGVGYPDLSSLDDEVILVGENIPPSLLADGDSGKIKGLVMTRGSRTAHVCILAANMGIPAVVGCGDVDGLAEHEEIYLDAVSGTLNYGMDREEIIRAREDVIRYQEEIEKLQFFRDKPACTEDGMRVQLLANIIDADTCSKVLDVGADGVGLFRTEFLYMNKKKLPSEMEQFTIYKSVIKKLAPMPVTIRTMDIGGDKEAEALNLSKEENPFLGYRAIRICLDRPQILEVQLRAILRASIYGKAQIMFPMICCMEELEKSLSILEKVKKDMQCERIPYDTDIPVGMMVEVPSVAVMADKFIRKVDFFSIGSNDLTQYTLAVDRQNEKIANLYDYLHPGVLRMIRNTIEACEKVKKPCSLCGEMAADIQAIPILLGLGLRKFSVNPSSVLLIKKLLAKCNMKEIECLAENICSAESSKEVRQRLQVVKE